MERKEPLEVTEARLETPFRAKEIAPFVAASRTILRISTGASPIEISFHRYVCRMGNAVYSPRALGLLSEDRGTVVSAHPLDVGLPVDGRSFGYLERVLEGRVLRLHYPPPKQTVRGAAICLYYSRGAAVFLRDILLGAFRARRMLGAALPILVPSDLSDRERSFLGLIGVTAPNLVTVPSDGTVTVE